MGVRGTLPALRALILDQRRRVLQMYLSRSDRDLVVQGPQFMGNVTTKSVIRENSVSDFVADPYNFLVGETRKDQSGSIQSP